MPNRTPRKKMNPQLIKEQAVQDAITIAGKNFVELFGRLDKQRFARSNSLVSTATYSAPVNTLVSDLQVALPVTGSKPVLVGLASEKVGSNVSTLGYVLVSADGGVYDEVGGNFNYLADGVSFSNLYKYTTYLGLTSVASVPKKILRGVITSAGAKQRGDGWTVSSGGTGIYNVSFDSAFDTTPIVTLGVENSLAATVAADKFYLAVSSINTTSMTIRSLVDFGAGTVAVGASFCAVSQENIDAATPGGTLQISYSPSELWAIHRPTNPGIVTYSLQLTKKNAEDFTLSNGLYLFACELL